MSIIVQLIDVEWTKKSRGMPAAKMRNAIPETFPFVANNLDDDAVYLQNVNYYEYDAFKAPRIKDTIKINEFQQRQNQLSFINNGLDIYVLSFGLPFRKEDGKAKNIGSLSNNSWLRIIGYSRVSGEDTWYYHKYVFNIFRGNAVMFDEVLNSQKPKVIFKYESNLR